MHTTPPTVPLPPRRPLPAPPVDTPPPTLRLAGIVAASPAFAASSGTGGSGPGFDADSTAGPAPTMPEVGERYEGFQLVEELGRGTFGRVFLARQSALADRPVALKVTLRPTREPDRLARLQHTNVVPVYSVHAAGRAQLICMPFLGRRTLADALKSHRSSVRSGWSGKATRAQRGSTTVTTGATRPKSAAPRPAGAAPDAPPDELVGDPVAVLKLLSQLAAGLGHAHDRGILHLDIKPGNVLLADTGEPMLLDFNLSTDAAEADRELVGGTVPYMAPEQLLDMRSRGKGAVDARTDLYSLGVVAYELLTGDAPFAGGSRSLADFDRLMAARRAGPPPLREKNPAVTPAVESIVRKLLAPDQAARYQSAAELKEDVDRQLADRPLRFARERSVVERARKWRRRNPRLLVGCAVALVLLGAAGSGAYAVQASDRQASAEARLAADEARAKMHGLRLDLTVPNEPIHAARGVARGRDLLAAYGLPDDPNWRERDAFHRLPAATRAELTGDFGELLVLLARSRLAAARDMAGPEAESARAEATRYVRAAGDCFSDGPAPPALVRVARELGQTEEPETPPATARDHFLAAADHVRAGRFAEAVTGLEEVTLQEPGHAAAQFLLGHALDRLGRRERAAERYAVAAGLMPGDPWPVLEWGWTEVRSGNPDRAVRILTRAAATTATPSSAVRYALGFARLRAGQYAEATADLSASLGFRPLTGLLVRAEAREKAGDRAGATDDRRAAFAISAAGPAELRDRGVVRESTDPSGARSDYRQALDIPGAVLPDAYAGLLRIALDRQDDAAEALRVADEAVSHFPTRADLHAGRAVALARLGRATEAREVTSVVDRLNPGAAEAFRVAGALARSTDSADREAALGWLRRAYLMGLRDPGRYDTAPDLVRLRETPEYQAFRAAAAELGRKVVVK